jgi:glycosyltransferase involved in cell wall biosynthesis
LPSKYEAFGLALIEAMMFKVPVIASNIGGPKEIIEDTQTGFLVNFGNIKQMCDKIELLNTNKKLYNYIVNKAYKRYHKFFNSKLMSNKYFNLLK